MEEIDLKEIFSYYWKKKLVIILATLLTVLVGLCYSVFLKKPMYKSEVTILLVSEQTATTQSDVVLNQQLVKTYSEIVKSRTVLKKVKRSLKLERSIDTLMGMIQVSNVTGTEILRIRVNSDDYDEAAEIANELSLVFQDEVEEKFNLQNVSIIDKAEVSKKAYNINVVKDAVIYLAVGLVLSCGVIFLMFYFDTTVKTAEQIEKKLGISVIGTVPKMEKRG